MILLTCGILNKVKKQKKNKQIDTEDRLVGTWREGQNG